MKKEKKDVILVCHLGEILKQRGISVLQFSEAIGQRRSTINDLINNKEMEKRRIPAQLIADVCSYLKIKPNDLFSVREKE